jgi:hypothetical protein
MAHFLFFIQGIRLLFVGFFYFFYGGNCGFFKKVFGCGRLTTLCNFFSEKSVKKIED